MDLINAKYNSTRNCVVVHGKEYTVKVQRGRYYIHADNRQITVTDVVKAPVDNYDPVWYGLPSGTALKYKCSFNN